MKLIWPVINFFILLFQSIALAVRQIWANKTRSALTTIGLVIGVASVTAVIAALTGLKTKILHEFSTIASAKSIYVMGDRPDHGPHKNAPWYAIMLQPEEFDSMLQHCPSIENFTRICNYNQELRSGERTLESIPTTGINRSWHKIENRSIILGRPFSIIDQTHARQVCLITPTTRDNLHMDRDCIGQTVILGAKTFRVIGLVENRVESAMFQQLGGEASKGEVFIPFDTAWKQLGRTWIHVIASSKSTELAEDARAELRFYLRRVRRLAPGDPDTFRIEVVEKMLEGFRKIAAILTAVAGGIVAISLLVGGVGIMNIMLVSVSERTREIGLRKAVGARPSAIMLQFLVEAVILCFLGGLLGVIVGQLLTVAMANIPNGLDKAFIPLWAIGVSFGFSGIVGVFFGMFPAIKAARLDPIEALRHE